MDKPPKTSATKPQSNQHSTIESKPDLDLSKNRVSTAPTSTIDRPFKEPEPKRYDEFVDNTPLTAPISSVTEQSQMQSMPPMSPMSPAMADNNSIAPHLEKELVAYNHITYLLYMVSFFTAGLTWVIPIAMNYMRRGDAEYSWLATHFDWQIKTFWYSVILGFIGMVLVIFGGGGSLASLVTLMFTDSGGAVFGGSIMTMVLGALIIFIAYIWHLYRLIKGWIALASKRLVA